MGNRKYCHPLTIADTRSRFIFTAKAQYREDFKSAKAEFTRVFRKYGLPKQMHTDNGSPFGSVAAIQRFTRLSYWVIDLGILPVFSDPAHPEQNGRHERMHRDLKAACAAPSAYDLKSQENLTLLLKSIIMLYHMKLWTWKHQLKYTNDHTEFFLKEYENMTILRT